MLFIFILLLLDDNEEFEDSVPASSSSRCRNTTAMEQDEGGGRGPLACLFLNPLLLLLRTPYKRIGACCFSYQVPVTDDYNEPPGCRVRV
mmetsp:Transcript_196/g.295  ORF Transcript_196/g.295 Transcript_196/m.295 type:complete len:90 (+) Transcript_196:1069-1338(+)